MDGGIFESVTVLVQGETAKIRARAFVAAAGGFESNLEWLKEAWGDAADNFLGSDAPLSIIREGSGYWKYIPTRDGVRFLTCYDYRTRFGAAGAIFDRVVFRRSLAGPRRGASIGCDCGWRNVLIRESRFARH